MAPGVQDGLKLFINTILARRHLNLILRIFNDVASVLINFTTIN